MRTFAKMMACAMAVLCSSQMLWAQSKGKSIVETNKWLAEKIESTGTSNYLLAILAVLGAALLLALGMIRKSRRG